MKGIIKNFWVQLFLGLIVGFVGAAISFVLMVIFWIKYSGFSFFGLGSGGDDSPITYITASLFTVLTFAFPTLLWFFLHKFGNLKSVTKKVRIVTFLIFATLPLWTYIGWRATSKLRVAYKNYQSVRDACIVKDGVNRINDGEETKDIECKNGVFNGFTRTYNLKGVLVYEGFFLNGKLDGTENIYYDNGSIKSSTGYKNGVREGMEVFYNEDGSTSLYAINNLGKSQQVYFQSPERNLDSEIGLETQKFLCENQEKYLLTTYSYVCKGSLIDGEFVKRDTRDNIVLKVDIENGVLNGIYDQYTDGILYRHLEFQNGKLNGKVYKYSTDGNLEYEGQYIIGLQDGIFRRYDYKGNVNSEVVFEAGKIIKINVP